MQFSKEGNTFPQDYWNPCDDHFINKACVEKALNNFAAIYVQITEALTV